MKKSKIKIDKLMDECNELLAKISEVTGMRPKVYDMTETQFEEFEANMTFKDLLSLDDEERDWVSRDVVEEIVCEQDYELMEDRIYYKELFNIPLDEEDEDYLDWMDKIDGDLGPPLM